jgi:hypothetical protein
MDLKLFILVRAFVRIRHCRTLEFVSSLTLPPKIFEFWYLIVGIQPVAKFGLPEFGGVTRFRRTRFRPYCLDSRQCGQNLEIFDGFRLYWSESNVGDQMLLDFDDGCRIPFYTFLFLFFFRTS